MLDKVMNQNGINLAVALQKNNMSQQFLYNPMIKLYDIQQMKL